MKKHERFPLGAERVVVVESGTFSVDHGAFCDFYTDFATKREFKNFVHKNMDEGVVVEIYTITKPPKGWKG